MSTQQGFGLILNELARSSEPLADRIVTTSPDVTVSTNLGAWVNRRGLFAREELKDLFKSERIPSTFTWDFGPKGQHIELGIAEMNLFILLSALGPLAFAVRRAAPAHRHALRPVHRAGPRCPQLCLLPGCPLHPRCDALRRDARARKAARTNRSRPPLIGIAQDGLAAFEPAFVDELVGDPALGLRLHAAKSGDGEPNERSWLRDETGGSVYLRLSTRDLEQPQRAMTPELADDIVDGAYWMRRPGPNAQVVVAYAGAVAPEAIEAVGLMAEDRRDVGLLAVTSADRLNAGWTAAQRARERGLSRRESHIERLLGDVPPHCGLVTVLDGHPATLAWLGSVDGPPHPLARRRAFRPDRHDPGPLPPFRHRRPGHHCRRRHDRARPPHSPFEGNRLTEPADAAITGP